MLNIYLSDSGRMLEQDQILPGSWINLCDPNEKEIGRVCAQLHVDPDLVRAALDEEERSRIEVEDNGHILIIVDTPAMERDETGVVYSTLPMGIIVTEKHIVTVCLKETSVVRDLQDGLVKDVRTRRLASPAPPRSPSNRR